MAKDKKRKRARNGAKPPEGKRFSSENQPSPEAKKAGWAHKRAMESLANAVLDKNSEHVKVLEQIASKFGIEIEKYTITTAMTLRQIEKAFAKGDTQAFNAAMDRLVGKPEAKHEHQMSEQMTIKIVRNAKDSTDDKAT